MRLRQKPAVALSLWPKKPSWKIIGTWGDCWNCSNPRLAFHLSGLLQRFDGSSPASAGLAPRAGPLRVLSVSCPTHPSPLPDRSYHRRKTRGADYIRELSSVVLFL